MAKILIIEDEVNIAELEKDYLESNGFEVEVEHDGQKGLDKALENTYSLVIVDLMLPNLSGFSIIKRIREQKDIPLLVVSAKLKEVDKIRGLGLGADDYITKPFSPGELVARVKSNLMKYNRLVGKGIEEDTITVGDLTIELSTHEVLLNGESLIFTSKEFELLAFMAQNPNVAFSKERLFSRIWGADNYGDIATVTVHIQKIRSKIEEDSSHPKYIETVWGVGYRFVD
ncbi:MAG: response regulator transcription factor [Clostridiales bacterium]|nr:response regulator transcription factor [Clostridiales bacterium]